MMRTVFDSQLALLEAQMLVMASSMEEAVVGAVEVLESRDKERARAIMEELNRQIDLELPRELTIDLEGVTFMDSSGIAVLLRAWRRVGELGGSVQVVNVPAQAAKVLKTAGLDKLMKFA